MSKVAITSTLLDDLADAISAKSGEPTPMTIEDMTDAVEGIQPGGSPNLQTKSVTPTESAQVITADQGYDGLDEVDVAAISSSFVGSGITRRDDTDLSASGPTVSVPAGYYADAETKTIANGSEGTPSATKGSVSNHSVTVTPSVTNTAGYIQGGTHTGTGVSVSASELVSGNKSINQNGTDIDVTNYETVSVSVPSGGATVKTASTTAGNSYPTSISFTDLTHAPSAFVVRLAAFQLASSGSTTYYYVVDIVYDGTNVHGNCFRVGSTRRIDNVDTGYSYTYSNGTLTVSSSASSRSSSPGAFSANSDYDLIYAY